ncbi:MAG TPA: DNA polymerase III subunit alpha, partial [Acidobacteriota bacterium]|nr:DNA polymerase III subunit alpha [Acidobacteriota bacterium]
MPQNAKFTHLHLHSHFSLLDGANKLEKVVGKAVDMGMPALALTDHGNLFGAVQFHDICNKRGIKPIIGCEVYVAQGSRKERSGRSAGANHLVLLAKDAAGYHNLVKLVSSGYLEGFYYKPRIDMDLLSEHAQGLIALSACLKGRVAENLAQDNFAAALEHASQMKDIFAPGDYYLEVQNHGIDDQIKTNPDIIKIAQDLELPVVCSNDCHYLERGDAYAHDVLLCVQTGKTIEDTNRLKYHSDEFFFKSPEEMEQLFGHIPGALSNTLEVAEKCNFTLPEPYTQNLYPVPEVPEGFTVESYLEHVCKQGYKERLEYLKKREKEGKLRHSFDEYEQRLDHELKIINQMNYPGYFLITWDFIRFAKEAGIPVGPGRGSAAGSLVSYVLGITDVDPLQYDLLFERFLNPERVSPPDIDIDFCTHRRADVIKYVTRKYGQDNVCQIITFGTMAARGVVRDVGRGLNVPLNEVNKIAKLVPNTPGASLSRALETERDLQDLKSEDPRYKTLLETAQRLEGLARHCSTHAAGVVIAPKPLVELVPIYKSPKEEITTQYPMGDLERLGLLKMDFLGLTTLTIIQQTLDQIKAQFKQEIDLLGITLKDERTYELFSQGRTSGIFQFESSGMREILKKLQPSRFDDLIALNALYRPGPLKGGMVDDFIQRRHGKVKVKYPLPELEEILEPTYGVIVYQEQVMQIASTLAGFSLGEADLLRRAMGKKKMSVMQEQKRKFLDGAKKLGKDLKKAEFIFDLIKEFAGYGFNKSHSTAYALLAYQTAYLKAHYPAQFMAALLTAETSNTDKIVRYMAECGDMGLKIKPPDINTSSLYFEAQGRDTINFGMLAIKNVGENAIRNIIETRERLSEGRYASLYEFVEEVDLRQINKRVVESLIKSGCFDSLGYKRRSLMEHLDSAFEIGQKRQRDRASGQGGLFAAMEAAAPEEESLDDIPDVGEWGDSEKWSYEKETLGFYVSGHPLEKYRAELKQFSRMPISSLNDDMAGRDIRLGGVITSVARKKTRRGANMAILTLEDLTGTIEVVVFPKAYEELHDRLETDEPVLITGKLDANAQGNTQILLNELTPLADSWKNGIQRAQIRVLISELDEDKLSSLRFIFSRHRGRCPVEFELL